MKTPVLIVGGGMAGLTAARVLSDHHISARVLEARDRLGGRIHTLRSRRGTTMELGAEFVHGEPAPLMDMIKKWGLRREVLDQQQSVFENGKLDQRRDPDIDTVLEHLTDNPVEQTVQQALHTLPPDQAGWAARFVENFHAADLNIMGLMALAEEKKAEGDSASHGSRLPDGYSQLVDNLTPEILDLRCEVRRIEWQAGQVRVHGQCQGQPHTWEGEKALITLPIGVLKSGRVEFYPALPDKNLDAIEMGSAHRIVLELDTELFKDNSDLLKRFVHHHDYKGFPVWWLQPIGSVVRATGWIGGPRAVALGHLPDDMIYAHAIEDVSRLLNRSPPAVATAVSEWHFHNWQTDPYALGAYSYLGLHGFQAVQDLARPVQNTLFFAGEATAHHAPRATVDAAIISGRRAAHEIIGS